jgi:hypothetical protein
VAAAAAAAASASASARGKAVAALSSSDPREAAAAAAFLRAQNLSQLAPRIDPFALYSAAACTALELRALLRAGEGEASTVVVADRVPPVQPSMLALFPAL